MQKENKVFSHSINSEVKVEYSSQTNLIEQSSYHYSLQEREDPNLQRYLFDYESVPKVSFNHRYVPVQMPDDIWITDTTFRDGQQATFPRSRLRTSINCSTSSAAKTA